MVCSLEQLRNALGVSNVRLVQFFKHACLSGVLLLTLPEYFF